MPVVDPRCKRNMSAPYINAHGDFFPCCWVMSEPDMSELREFLGNMYEQLSMKGRTLDDVRNSDAMKAIENSWENGTFKPCVWACKAREDNGEPKPRYEQLSIDLSKWKINSSTGE